MNLCARFILPMVGINYKTLPQNFINAYIDDDYLVKIVFDKVENYDIVFQDYYQRLSDNNNHFIEYSEDLDEIICIFRIPTEHEINYNLFKEGKYSKFTEDYKKVIVNYFGRKSIPDSYLVTEYNTIYPQDFKRKQIAERLFEQKDVKEGVKLIEEVMDPPNLQREYFKPLDRLLQQQESQSVNNSNNIYELKQ